MAQRIRRGRTEREAANSALCKRLDKDVLCELCPVSAASAVKSLYSRIRDSSNRITHLEGGGRRIFLCPRQPAPRHRRSPPSSRYKFGLPTAPGCRDRDCGDCLWNCRTRQRLRASFLREETAAVPAGSLTANKNRSSHEGEFRGFRRWSRCCIRISSHASAYAEKS